MPNLHFQLAYTNSLFPSVHTFSVGCWWLTASVRHALLPGSEDDRGPADEKATPQEGLSARKGLTLAVATASPGHAREQSRSCYVNPANTTGPHVAEQH